MRKKEKRNAVILLLIIAMFFSGMCFDSSKSVKAASSFLETQNSSSGSSFLSVESMINQKDYCIVEQLGEMTLRVTMELVKRSFSKSFDRTKSRSGNFVAVQNYLFEQSNLYSMEDMLGTCNGIIRSQNFIITYIHRQDGAKG